SLIGLAGLALLWRRQSLAATARRVRRLAVYPVVALILFSANSRWTTGTWFVPAGFFVPENDALGNAALAFTHVRESVVLLSGPAWLWPAYAASAVLLVTVIRTRSRASLLLV